MGLERAPEGAETTCLPEVGLYGVDKYCQLKDMRQGTGNATGPHA
jgi:hypothetical protein